MCVKNSYRVAVWLDSFLEMGKFVKKNLVKEAHGFLFIFTLLVPGT